MHQKLILEIKEKGIIKIENFLTKELDDIENCSYYSRSKTIQKVIFSKIEHWF